MVTKTEEQREWESREKFKGKTNGKNKKEHWVTRKGETSKCAGEED